MFSSSDVDLLAPHVDLETFPAPVSGGIFHLDPACSRAEDEWWEGTATVLTLLADGHACECTRRHAPPQALERGAALRDLAHSAGRAEQARRQWGSPEELAGTVRELWTLREDLSGSTHPRAAGHVQGLLTEAIETVRERIIGPRSQEVRVMVAPLGERTRRDRRAGGTLLAIGADVETWLMGRRWSGLVSAAVAGELGQNGWLLATSTTTRTEVDEEELETALALWEPDGPGPLGEADGALEAAGRVHRPR